MHRRLLVPNEDVLKLVLLEDLVVDVQDGPSGVPEDVRDAFVLQRSYNDFCAGELHFANSSQSPREIDRMPSMRACGARCGGGARRFYAVTTG